MEEIRELVLVTGGTGFVGAHCILKLLKDGYRVRTTLRSFNRAEFVKRMLMNGGASERQIDSVQFQVADLSGRPDDSCWADACKDCDFVLHIATPMHESGRSKNEDELIVPARDGTLRVLEGAKQAGVKRVVITSSWAAIAFGHAPSRAAGVFTEHDWTEIENPQSAVPAYHKSKTMAERAAWDWIATDGGDMELVTVNPTGIIGPILAKEAVSSNELIASMLSGQLPGVLRLSFPLVDVRDLADLHIRAMTATAAKGERFVAVSEEGTIWCRDIAGMLKFRMGNEAKRASTREVPNWIFKAIGWFDSDVAEIVPELGIEKKSSSEKARNLLGWKTRSTEETVVDAAESLIRFGVVK